MFPGPPHRRADPGPNGAGADVGAAPPGVESVLARRAAGTATLAEVVAILAPSRLLVPLMQVPADSVLGGAAEPCADTGAAMAVVSSRGADGSTQALAFTSLATLGRWRPDARPLPKPTAQVAQAAIAGGSRTLLLDPGSPAGLAITGPWLVRLAAGRDCPPPWADEYVAQAVGAEVCSLLGVATLADAGVRVRLAPAEPDGAVDLLVILGGSDHPVGPLVAQLAERLAASPLLAAVFEGTLAVVPR